MKFRFCLSAVAAFLFCCLAGTQTLAQNAYITNSDGTVSVIDTTSNTVAATIAVGNEPFGVAVTPDGSTVYVTNLLSNTVSVIDAASNTVTATIGVGSGPLGVAVTPDGSTVYVTNSLSNTVSVIDAASNTVTATIGVGRTGVAVTPDGSKVYVTNAAEATVSAIDTATHTVIATISVASDPIGVAVTPDSSTLYVANGDPDTVSVIDTTSNTVTATIAVGSFPVGVGPVAFGVFIQPPPSFAGTPGLSNCYSQSVAALARQFVGLNAAAAGLGFRSAQAVQAAIMTFCHGRPTIALSHQ
jgi:YVTN family beta-propeller protein